MREYVSLIRLLYSELGPYRFRFCALGAIGALDAAVAFGIPWSIARLVSAHESQETLFAIVFALFCLSLIFQFFLRKFAEALGPEVSFYLRSTLLSKASKVPLTKIQKLHTGYLLSLTTTVAESTGTLVTSSLWGLVRVVTILFLFFLSVFLESPLVAGINAAFLCVFVLVSRRLAAPVSALTKAANLSRAKALAVYADFMGQLRTLFRLRLFSFAEKKIVDETQGAIEAVKNFQSFHARRWFLLHSLYGGAFFSTLALLLWGIHNKSIPEAMLILFVGAFAQVRGNLEWMAENFVTIKNFLQVSADLSDAFSTDAQEHAAELKSDWKTLSLSHVKFQYEEDAPFIEIPSLDIQKNDWWIIRGASGEGKTTLLHLLSFLYLPQEGEILVDGKSNTRISAALVSQESELFSISLRENLTLGNSSISDDRLKDLCKKLGLEAWLSELPQGFESVLGERGQFLSAGQRQRLNLIRGILLDCDLYLLDEPATHLDEVNRDLLLRCIEDELQDKTVILVSHQSLNLKRSTKEARFNNHILISNDFK